MQGLQKTNMVPGPPTNELAYLSQKRVLLSNPGTKMDNIYYSSANTTVELAEATYNNGRLFISLNQHNFGSQSQVVIPNSSLLNEVYLHLQLEKIVPNQTLTRGWGYKIIDSISYLFGSSNVSQISINGDSLFQTIMMESETSEKRSEMFRLGGQEILNQGAVDITTGLDAYVLLPLPFSSANGLFSKLPFDTNLLSNPITIQIQFGQASKIIGGSGASTVSQFTKAAIYVRQGELYNKDQSLKFQLMKNPSIMYSYPFIHHQSYTPQGFTGSVDPNSRVSVPLLSFINADLLAISVGIIKDSDLSPTGGNTPNLFNYQEMSNVRLTFNGLIMYESPAKLWKLYNMKSQIGSSYLFNSIVQPGATAPFNSVPVDTYILIFDFSRIRSLSYQNEYQNVWRISNNTLTLEFNTPDTSTYHLYATYHYNGVCEVQGGQTRIYFD